MLMHHGRTLAAAVALALSGLATQGCAQDPKPLAVGQPAPDFVLTAATQNGVAPDPLRLRDFRGQTVVLAFFYKARTGG
jgi:peroxiredoxin Q/BCP